MEQSRVTLASALQVAQNTPIQLAAAEATVEQATARYKAGLATIIEVAEAQRLLTQAEIDNGLAKLGIWRAKLSLSLAQGDLAPFLSAARK
jgi:outer membrane protein TolC